jgi:hypothetical protein
MLHRSGEAIGINIRQLIILAIFIVFSSKDVKILVIIRRNFRQQNCKFFLAPLGALHNNPPQHGGVKYSINFALKRQCQSALHCPFRAEEKLAILQPLRNMSYNRTMNKQKQQNKYIKYSRDWFILVPIFMILYFILYNAYGLYSLTTRTGENVKKVWWLPKECSSVSYSFCQSDKIYEYHISENDFTQSENYRHENFLKIGDCPIKIIRYLAILPSNRNQFLSEIYMFDNELQNEYSCFRIVKNGFYCLEEHQNRILYFVFDQDMHKMYCYINTSKNGIRIDTTDPYNEYIRKNSTIMRVIRKEEKSTNE